MLLLSTLCTSVVRADSEATYFLLPDYRLAAAQLAVVVNDASSLSVRIGTYYQQRRHLPAENLIHVHLPVDRPEISPQAFADVYRRIQEQTPAAVQAYALAWLQPYRVGCMSITSALALGYDAEFCQQKPAGQCREDRQPNPYFNSMSLAPQTDHGVRPAMLLAAPDWPQARDLIERGLRADATRPTGSAYLLDTSDKARNVRALQYPQIEQVLGKQFSIQVVHANTLRDRQDVMFYFTGLSRVEGLDSLRFFPGAVADHLTSTGGVLPGSAQMSIMEWLAAGATGSYGAVIEPCNYPQKFPAPGVLLYHYLSGATLLEAYWKSVAWVKEGVFIGEPLAAPFSGYALQRQDGRLLLQTSVLRPGLYQLQTSASELGPFSRETVLLAVRPGEQQFNLPDLRQRVIKLVRINQGGAAQ